MSWRKACTTAGAIATLGDVGMQLREQQVSTKRAVALADVDSGRTARIVAYRVLQAPLVELSWRALDSRLPLRGAAHAALVVGADQLFLLPTWTAIFYYSQSAMEGRSHGEGVERVFPLHSPNIDSITVVRRGRVRRAKLYYLRTRRGKSARIAEKVTHKTAKK